MTAVLVFGAVVTVVIASVADGAAANPIGIALVTIGAAVIAVAPLRRPADRLSVT